MTRYFWLSLALLISVSVSTSFAQKKAKKTKEEVAEEKEWAKKLKLLKPLDYKKLLDEKNALTTQAADADNAANSAKSELNSVKSQMDSKDAEIAKLKKELEDYNSGVTPGVAAEAKADETTGTTTVARPKGPSKGVNYKVQIGSFKTKDLSKYFDNNPNFSGEVDPDGAKKYTLGVFTDYWEADKFKKALRDMGVKGAWVVPYKNGQRVNIKDVLEGAL